MVVHPFHFQGMKRSNSPQEDKPGLTVEYPPLTVSSENLADDEREDTSDGEIEPEPDYDDDSYSGKFVWMAYI